MNSAFAAIEYLVATCTRDLVPRVENGVKISPQIIDGPPLVNLEKDGITIGWSPDELAVVSTEEGAGLDTTVETFDINCTAWSRTGEEMSKVARDNLRRLLDLVEQVLDHDRRLGGAVVHARLRVADLDQMHNEDGTWAVAGFAISCKAFR